jgi:hypothetical protein
MNHYKPTAQFLSVILLFFLSSCNIEPFEAETLEEAGVEETDNNNGSGQNDNFFAKVDGVEFKEDLINVSVVSSNIFISALKPNRQETIAFILDSDIEVGKHSFSLFATPSAVYTKSVSDQNTGKGTIAITSHDTSNKTIKATFQFTASSIAGGSKSYKITEGSFTVTY